MENKIVRALYTIHNRLEELRDLITFKEVLELNLPEIDFLATHFKLDKEEALMLAASCIRTVVHVSYKFDYKDLADILVMDNFEVLLQYKCLKSLVEKDFLIEIAKTNYPIKSAIDLQNKDFVLHHSLSAHIN